MTRASLSQLRYEYCQNPALLLSHYARDISGQAKCNAIATLLAAVRKIVQDDGLINLYKIAFERWKSGLSSGKNAVAVDLATAGFLRIGAGNDNALEFSLRLHPLYGVPMIPGSAIKGLAAHYCHEVWGGADENFKRNGEFHKLMFGAAEDSGIIIFHDAWITSDSLKHGAIVQDVMTPHHPNSQQNMTAPTDFDSPVPVPCLSVRGGFHFVLACGGMFMKDEEEKRKEWLALALDLVKEAVGNWGIGGKTAGGYGRMTEKKPAEIPATAKPGGGAPGIPAGGTGKRPHGTCVTLTFMGPREDGKKGYRAQEAGRAAGILCLDEPPTPLPEIGSTFKGYIKDDARSPQYLWKAPDVKSTSAGRTGQSSQSKRGG